jgi:hypothetical protein
MRQIIEDEKSALKIIGKICGNFCVFDVMFNLNLIYS